MAVRVTGVGEVPDVSTYNDATATDVDEDRLVVVRGIDVLAVFHRNHWSKAEIFEAEVES